MSSFDRSFQFLIILSLSDLPGIEDEVGDCDEIGGS